MRSVVKLNGQWSAFEIALLTEMVARGDLLTEAADTLERRIDEVRRTIRELRLSATPLQLSQSIAA
jgi:hypothetical protein